MAEIAPARPLGAVILAAGLGSRLGAEARGAPKGLTPVAGRAILDYALAACEAWRQRQIVVVTGFRAAQIQAHLGDRPDVRCVINPNYARTGTAVSTLIGLDTLAPGGPRLIIEGDTAFDTEVVARLQAANGSAVIAAAPYNPALHSGTYLLVAPDGGVDRLAHARLGPPPLGAPNLFKTANVMLFSADAAAQLRAALVATIDQDGQDAPLEYALARLAQQRRLSIVDIGDLPWFEVDTPQDLALAERIFTPTDGRGAP
jgi:choline kinase